METNTNKNGNSETKKQYMKRKKLDGLTQDWIQQRKRSVNPKTEQ